MYNMIKHIILWNFQERLDRISSITKYYRSEAMRVQKEAQ